MSSLTIEDIEILTGDVMSAELHSLLCDSAYYHCGGDETKFDEKLIEIIMANRNRDGE